MRQDYTDITIILDDSGSMGGIVEDTIAGFNSFIKEQQKEKGKLRVTVVTFGSPSNYKVLHNNINVNEVTELTRDDYNARSGGTALFDAFVRTVEETGERLRRMKEEERPSKVLVLTMTDGEENSSIAWPYGRGRKKISEQIEHQKSKYGWNFIFVGADLSKEEAEASYGEVATCGMLELNKHNTRAFYGNLSNKVSLYRSSNSVQEADASLQYSAEERAELKS